MVFNRSTYTNLFVHIIVWILFYSILSYPFLSEGGSFPLFMLPRMVSIIILFYINYFYFVPRFLLNKGVLFYLVLSLVCITLVVILENILLSQPPPRVFGPMGLNGVGARYRPSSVSRAVELIDMPRGDFRFRPFFASFVRLGIPYSISSILRIYLEWKKNNNLREEIEKENIKSELQLLKNQLDPHFLFNSLNTIYALSVKKSLDTSQAVVNLSELMRYMIYEADKDMVPLTKELDYIKSYVQLQLLRLSDSENVTLKISGEDKGRAIPPLIFISFIENAFKYGTDYNGKTSIRIELCISNESIRFFIDNKIGVIRKSAKSSGIGLENVRNRLNLLYPNMHTLNVFNNGVNYRVELELKNLKTAG
ncbi:histidine kinase [Maribacter sp. MMG018]|uniref:sensor histidine kinase n=1 Tax=Maribacter sp. MMG018 TaxID=2822688 RepID=UPI001B38D295|nr:histidine kinase [Maribacter sp. MMG018]MBQ4914522.1 histidine kinase [Maribacter sp. MMG018]